MYSGTLKGIKDGGKAWGTNHPPYVMMHALRAWKKKDMHQAHRLA